MKIKCEYPFENFIGYIVTNKEPRKHICLISQLDKKRTTISYARYLMSVKEKRILEKNEVVDHIDNDKSNDVIENLQILSYLENNLKNLKHRGIELAKPITTLCPICKKDFIRPSRSILYKINKGKKPCCSRTCGGKFSHIQRKKQV